MAIRYARNVVGGFQFLDRPCRPHGQGADGYGSKITTHRMLRFWGDSRLRRVYATCYSNAASHWIIYKGERLYI
jgi:hypothetical protein